MTNFIVNKVCKRRTKPVFFIDLTEALEDAKNKSLKNSAEYTVLRSYASDGSSTYYMEYARFINGKRTK